MMLAGGARLSSLNTFLMKKNAATLSACRYLSTPNLTKEEINRFLTTPPYTIPNKRKIVAPPMVYISGEEMTHYTMNLMYGR